MARPFLTAEWRHLVMLNYAVDPALLKPHVPAGTELDFHNGEAFISLVGFRFLQTRLLGLPIPFHRHFDEVNLRFYVKRTAADGLRRGVVFLREIVPRRAIAAVARMVYGENYCYAPMSSTITSNQLEYAWGRGERRCSLSAEWNGTFELPLPGSVGEYIIEHYWGYTRRNDTRTDEYRVSHPSWRVATGTSHRTDGDFSNWYEPGFAKLLKNPPQSMVVAEGSAVEVYPGTRLTV
jgi:uncharacterized protein YqjF (DUF2071 family)